MHLRLGPRYDADPFGSAGGAMAWAGIGIGSRIVRITDPMERPVCATVLCAARTSSWKWHATK